MIIRYKKNSKICTHSAAWSRKWQWIEERCFPWGCNPWVAFMTLCYIPYIYLNKHITDEHWHVVSACPRCSTPRRSSPADKQEGKQSWRWINSSFKAKMKNMKLAAQLIKENITNLEMVFGTPSRLLIPRCTVASSPDLLIPLFKASVRSFRPCKSTKWNHINSATYTCRHFITLKCINTSVTS